MRKLRLACFEETLKNLGAASLAASILFFCAGCSPNEKPANENGRLLLRQLNRPMPELGKRIDMKPAASTEVITKVQGSPSNVLMLIMRDGIPMSYGASVQILMYEKSTDKDPIYSFTASQLKNMHVTSNCGKEVLSYIQNAEGGDALFCNHALDLSKVHYFVAKESETDKDSLTSYTVDFSNKDKDLVAVTFNFD